MKKVIIISVLILSYAACSNAQVSRDIKAEINHVTVFPDRAQIEHEAQISLLPGKTLLKLSELSPYIDAQSVQVKGFGEFTILSVNHQNNYLDNLEDAPDLKNIRSQIEALQIKVEDEKAAISILKEKEAFLVANRAILVKETTLTPEQIRSIIDLYTSNMDQVIMTTLKKTRLIKEYEKQIEALQQQANNKMTRQQLPSGEISVTVSSDKQLTGKLLFSYVAGNAGWYPSYDIRVQDIKNPVTIFYKANVYQNSGVAWNDVKLTFSNATPWISGNIPVLYPWFIDFYNPVHVVTAYGINRSKATMSEKLVAPQAIMADEIAVEESVPVVVEKQIGTTTISFDVNVPYTIPSDGKIQTIEIQRLTAPADYKYVTLPKLSTLAYLTANVADWSKLSLQNGEATLYFENTFVSKTNLNVSQLTDTLLLSLGNDNSILVKREKRTDFTSKKTIGANKTETFSFLTTIRNNKTAPVKITLDDQIPVSSNSGISVDAVELSGGRHNIQTGEIKWDLELKPQETKQVVLTYSVKYPKDKSVVLQ